jgi:hypothetical protein
MSLNVIYYHCISLILDTILVTIFENSFFICSGNMKLNKINWWYGLIADLHNSAKVRASPLIYILERNWISGLLHLGHKMNIRILMDSKVVVRWISKILKVFSFFAAFERSLANKLQLNYWCRLIDLNLPHINPSVVTSATGRLKLLWNCNVRKG